jgi:uncharacterized membrane protein YebE (DUF533 family)
MFNASDLLGQILGSGMSNSTMNRVGHAMGPQGLGRSGNPLSELLSGLAGGGGGGGGMGRGGALGGLADMAQSMLGGATNAVQQGNPLAIGGLGGLAGAVLGGGSMEGALKGGAMALLGSLAFSALKNWNKEGAAPSNADELAKEAPIGLRQPQTPAEEEELQNSALLVLRGMINAAKADGQIDGAEMQRIAGKLKEAGADAEAQAFVVDELRKPMDMNGLTREVRTPELAVQVYAASLLAIEVDTPSEQDYMRRLAHGLGLNRQTVESVHEVLGIAAPA